MQWFQVLVIILSTVGTTMGMFLYLASKIDKLSDNINKEMRDFHGRLCSMEERRNK